MNQFFNIKRFAQVFKQDLVVNYKKIIVGILLMALSVVLAFSTLELNNKVAAMFYFAVIFGGMAYVVISSSNLSRHFYSKTQCINYLVLPGSNFEKYLSKVIFKTIIPFFLWMLMYYITYIYIDSETLKTPQDFYGGMVFLGALLSSICIFWGAVFRRFAIVFAAVGVTAFIVFLRTFIEKINFMFLDPIRIYIQSDETSTRLFIVLTIIDVIMFLVCAVLAYFIISRKQLILKPLNL